LENLIERLVVLGSDDHWIEEKDLPFDLLLREETNEDSSEGTMMDATWCRPGLPSSASTS